MIPKPPMITMPAHPTNQWSRYGLPFDYIVMHYVGAVSTARNNGNYYGNTPHIGASAHFFVDEHEIVASVPLTMSAGHCGVDYSGGKAPFWHKDGVDSTNRRSIGIEMCCKKDSKGNWFIEPETVTRTVALVKWLMQEFNIPIDHVIRHYDVCWKTCPEPWVRFPEQWQDFKRRLTEEKEEEEEMQRFKTIEEVPEALRPETEKLMKRGALKGKGGNLGLDVTEDMLRTMIVCQRMVDEDKEEEA